MDSAARPPKILSRNHNGTTVQTSSPTNVAELQLYRVLQSASLLSYYDTLLEMGGDDVQQLCDAGEEEFLEIMALVGMANKPLHVRRLQKALQEWINSPALFQCPLLSVTAEPAGAAGAAEAANHLIHSSSSSLQESEQGCEVASSFGNTSPSCGSAKDNSYSPRPNSPVQSSPTLIPLQISRLAKAAQKLVKTLRLSNEQKASVANRKHYKELEAVLSMEYDDPLRMEQIRKYAAIYGRFDCKRKAEKPLRLHEVCVNEAAAQICYLVPPLLSRRDELFPLARQVVRDSGYPYSKGHSKSHSVLPSSNTEEVARNKRSRRESSIVLSEPLSEDFSEQV